MPVRRSLVFVLGLVLVLTAWSGVRFHLLVSNLYGHFIYHPSTTIFQDMAVTMGEGRSLGEINLTRIQRNMRLFGEENISTERRPGDIYCNFRSLDPGFGIINAAANKIFFFMPNMGMRLIALQVILDGGLAVLIFLTFYPWGWVPAVFAGVLYSLHEIFALKALTVWYHFWEGLVGTLSLLIIFWLYRLSKSVRPRTRTLMALAVSLGLTLGCGVWLRSSWIILSPILLFITAIGVKTLRPWLACALLIYALFAGGMIWRASSLSGHFTISTRMLWHTAFQALGRYANPYGLEDDDLYVSERAYQEAGINYNPCDFGAEDRVTKKDYLTLWQQDSGFILQSFVQRSFDSIFSNASDIGKFTGVKTVWFRDLFWDRGMLSLAWLGIVIGLWLGGEYGMFSVVSIFMYLTLNICYALVYYIDYDYAYLTQVMIVFSATGAIAGILEMIRRYCRAGSFGNLPNPRSAFAALLISLAGGFALLLPSMHAYVTPHHAVSDHWQAASEISAMDPSLRQRMDQLSEARRTHLLAFLKAHGAQGADAYDLLFHYAAKNLWQSEFSNADGKVHVLWFSKQVNHRPIMRASQSIEGVGYEWVDGFDPARPESWDGMELHFKLLPNNLLPPQRIDALLKEKFSFWGWQLQSLGDREYLAKHTGDLCTPMQIQMAPYYFPKCQMLE